MSSYLETDFQSINIWNIFYIRNKYRVRLCNSSNVLHTSPFMELKWLTLFLVQPDHDEVEGFYPTVNSFTTHSYSIVESIQYILFSYKFLSYITLDIKGKWNRDIYRPFMWGYWTKLYPKNVHIPRFPAFF